MNAQQMLYFNHVLPFNRVLTEMQYGGLIYDTALHAQLKDMYETKINIIRAEINSLIGYEINPNSPQQLSKYLFKERKFSPMKQTDSGADSTDMFSILSIAYLYPDDPVLKLLKDYKKISTLNKMFIANAEQYWVKDKYGNTRIHPSYWQLATSGRLRCSDPNVQQYPRINSQYWPTDIKIRSLIKPKFGHKFIHFDWSQIEFRFAAFFSKDPVMLDYLLNKKDVHRLMASKIFGIPESDIKSSQRSVGKTTNFSCLFFNGAPTLQETFLVDADTYFTVAQCQTFIDAFFSTYSGYRNWSSEIKEKIRTWKYVENVYGRKRRFPDIDKLNPYVRKDRMLLDQYGREAVNHIIQGSSSGDFANINERAVDSMLKHNFPGSRLAILMHDGFEIEAPEDMCEKIIPAVKEICQRPHVDMGGLELPMDSKIMDDWGQA